MPAPTAAPHGRAVDRGDRRQRRSGDAQKTLVDLRQRLAVGFGQVSQVRPGAERGWRTRDDQRADFLIALDFIHRRRDVGDHFESHRVAFGGIIQRQNSHALAALDLHKTHEHLVCHIVSVITACWTMSSATR